MASPFTRTLRSLEADRLRGVGVGLAVAAALLGLWALWFFAGRVTVYASSASGRITTLESPVRVDAQVEGTVTAVLAQIGQSVTEGELLFTLDTEQIGLALDESRAREASLTAQLAALESTVQAAGAALVEDRAAGEAGRSADRAQAAAAAVLATQAEQEAARVSALAEQGTVSTAALADALARRDEALARSRAATAQQSQGERGQASAEKDREAELAELSAARDRVRGELEAEWARAAELERRYDHSFVAAPAAGELADLAPLALGARVLVGEPLAVIVPEGGLKVVALLSPEDALGRVRPGQPARLRLDGFPWTWFGTLGATVESVGGEPRDGLVRVELALDDAEESTLPLRHGLTCAVEIALEQASPASLALRAAGRLLDSPGEAAP